MLSMTGMLENKISFSNNFISKGVDITSTPLLDAMLNYKNSPMTGFHIPGHNRG